MYEPQQQRRYSNPHAFLPSGLFEQQPQSNIPETLNACLEQLKDEIQKLANDDHVHRIQFSAVDKDLTVYKSAYAQRDEECRRLSQELSKADDKYTQKNAEMQNRVQEYLMYIEDLKLQMRGHRITVLIDGDGTIFEDQLIAQGQAGGHFAAKKLSESISQHLTQVYGTHPYQIRVFVFLNKRGLADALGRAGYPAAKVRFDDFMMGFNLASERFIMVDVGSAKEAADAKIKALLEDEIKLPQTEKIIFAGCHDNGYGTTLRSHITAGFKDKLILLRGYADMAAGMNDLELPFFSIPDLFMSKKLVAMQPTIAVVPPASAPPHMTSFPTFQVPGPDHEAPLEMKSPVLQELEALPFASAIGAEISAAKPQPFSYSSAVQTRTSAKGKRESTPELDSSGSTTSSDDCDDAIPVTAGLRLTVARPRRVNPKLPLSKQKPPPCTLFYLANCRHGADCKYGHDYELTHEHYDEIRANAKKAPCPSKNKGEICLWGEDCCYGHHCPLTTKCHFFKQNRCKFIGADMHKEQKVVGTEMV